MYKYLHTIFMMLLAKNYINEFELFYPVVNLEI